MQSLAGIDFESQGTTIVITILQSIELYHITELHDAIETALGSNSYRHAIFQMADVRYMDSSGIGALLQIQQKYLGKIKLRFCDLQPNVRLIFEFTHLQKYFAIDQTLADSFKAIADSTVDSRFGD
jgi:anti-sigma B factor antagonist